VLPINTTIQQNIWEDNAVCVLFLGLILLNKDEKVKALRRSSIRRGPKGLDQENLQEAQGP